MPAVDLLDTAFVAAAVEGSFHPGPNDPYSLAGSEKTFSEGENVGVVVRSGEASRLLAPAETAADAWNTVGNHGFAVPRSAEDDAAVIFAACQGFRERANEERVVDRLGRVGAEVGDLVSPPAQLVDQELLGAESRVIGSESDVHGQGLSGSDERWSSFEAFSSQFCPSKGATSRCSMVSGSRQWTLTEKPSGFERGT